MIKLSYANLVRIAAAMGFEYGNSYDTLLNTLTEHDITVATQIISDNLDSANYILNFPTDNHEMLFRLKYSNYL